MFVSIRQEDVAYGRLPKQILCGGGAHSPSRKQRCQPRALMGANMQRQAVPLLIPGAAGRNRDELKSRRDSGNCQVARYDGSGLCFPRIPFASAGNDDTRNIDEYKLP